MTEENPTGPDRQGHLDQEPTAETDGELTSELSREEQLLSQIASLESELDETKDRFLRVHAEMENMRRRMDKERSDLLKYGLESLYKDMLPVLDSFDKALSDEPTAAVGEELKAHLEGMMLVKSQLHSITQKHGLEPIESKSHPFDPNVHQAIQRIESENVDNEIVGDEFARGYLLNGRLLRPAMVSVLVPKKSE